jgi:hypothetical protein
MSGSPEPLLTQNSAPSNHSPYLGLAEKPTPSPPQVRGGGGVFYRLRVQAGRGLAGVQRPPKVSRTMSALRRRASAL